MSHSPRIPDEYVEVRPGDQVGGKRIFTVRRFDTSIPFARGDILQGVQRSYLRFGSDFGIVRADGMDEPDSDVRALFGLIGDRNLVLVNKETSRLDFFRIKHVLLATMMVEFVSDPDSGMLGLLTYGGKQGQAEFRRTLREHFGVEKEPVARSFDPVAVRHLCEGYFGRLYQIVIDPLHQHGWGTINAADFRSKRKEYIDAEAERMRQVRENKLIVIQSFRSVLRDQIMEPFEGSHDIRFSLLKDGGVNIEIPEIEPPKGITEVRYETLLYDFARQSYRRIAGAEDLYKPLPQKDDAAQLGLW